MRETGRLLLVVGCALLAVGLVGALVGVVASSPAATGLGFLALVTCVGPATVLVAAGAVLRVVGAREARSRT